MKYYSVKFGENNRVYTFKSILPYKIGDEVMCDVSHSVLHGVIVREETTPERIKLATKFILSTRVDAEEFELTELLQKMRAREIDIPNINRFEMMSQHDNEMYRLWSRYAKLTGRTDESN